ncbi:hypothetical protein [Pseudomonas aeruginosa]|uniref:hypothetical protein n=1 Tax=Pseudomonas aeruginosa TaxID=287 RepID=UPI0021C0737D|nr:hypothetical protein [Pseudomonas aeruginosa]UXH58366.1 hypothetical protein N5877_28085 [Pseudomonas aeruginosa]
MSIDWTKAPEGATHYAPELEENDFWCSVFWRMENGVGVEAWSIDNRTGELHHFNRPTWIETTAKRLVPRPAACAHASTTWDGQGLPPVGLMVEWKAGLDHDWQRVTVLAYANGDAWFQPEDGPSFIVGNPANFRRIRTPEQIAAEERSKECDRIFVILSSVEREGNRSDMAEALYDAGYRRQEEGK